MTDVPELLREPLERLRRDLRRDDDAGRIRVLDVFERPLSTVARIEVDGPDGPSGVYVKRLLLVNGGPSLDKLAERVVKEATLARRLEAAVARHVGLGALRVLAVYPDLATAVTAEVRGQTLMQRIEQGTHVLRPEDQGLLPVMRHLSLWLREFQALEPPGPAVPVSELRDYIALRLARLAGARRARWTPTMSDRLLAHVTALGEAAGAGELTAVPIHADLAPGNVIVEGERVTVIDLAMARTGTRYHDLARLYSQLDQVGLKPWYSTRRIARLHHALLDSFEPGLTAGRPLFAFHVVLHRVNQFAKLATTSSSWLGHAWDARVAMWHRRWLLAQCGDSTLGTAARSAA